ncbi:hypothetical protein HUW51_01755 [Adhaeribacter swui]|uniref:Uncharacterized protein n=1 Tax=Adhaeribacter swui TaxID=2086471 RepID=A0A7G7G2X5_9BACT|nr:hypothetical protein [Adhaeribacter swui]QNF31509.1 hypothetical protein HUW51_01755 [Adhaeribacter swui]
MTQYKFTQLDWKSSLLVIVPVMLFQLVQDNLGFGMAMLLVIPTGILLAIISNKFFQSIVEFRDSDLCYKRGYFGKPEKIPYAQLEKLTYSNATRFLKLKVYANGNQIELPPPARLAQAKELFAWLQIKNPGTAFEIIQPKPALEEAKF